MAVKDGLPSTDFSRQNREYIKDLIEESGGGGGGLPEITEADEGKVLTVESGEAAWAEGGGGGGASVMTITVTDTGTALRLDKTFAEIAAAINAKTICYVVEFTENAETGFIRYNTSIVTHVERNPDHDEQDSEFMVQVGSDTYECASADAYPEYKY